MGNTNPRINSSYYDRYFGPNYNRIVGNSLGDYGQYYIGGSCCQSPSTTPPPPPPPLPPLPQCNPNPSLQQCNPPPFQIKPINLELKIQPSSEQPCQMLPQQISPSLPTFCPPDYSNNINNNRPLLPDPLIFRQEQTQQQPQQGPIFLPPVEVKSNTCLKPPPNINPPPPPPQNFQPQNLRFQNVPNLIPIQPRQMPQQPIIQKLNLPQQCNRPPMMLKQHQGPIITYPVKNQIINESPQIQSPYSSHSQSTNLIYTAGTSQLSTSSQHNLSLLKSGQQSVKRYSHYDMPLSSKNYRGVKSQQLITIDEQIIDNSICQTEEYVYRRNKPLSQQPYRLSHKSLSNFSNPSRITTYYLPPHKSSDHKKFDKYTNLFSNSKIINSGRSSYDLSLDLDQNYSQETKQYYV